MVSITPAEQYDTVCRLHDPEGHGTSTDRTRECSCSRGQRKHNWPLNHYHRRAVSVSNLKPVLMKRLMSAVLVRKPEADADAKDRSPKGIKSRK